MAFMRLSPKKRLICVGNFSAVPRTQYRLALPVEGEYKVLINSDLDVYAGGGTMRIEELVTEDATHNGRPYSARLELPPLSTLWLDVPN